MSGPLKKAKKPGGKRSRSVYRNVDLEKLPAAFIEGRRGKEKGPMERYKCKESKNNGEKKKYTSKPQSILGRRGGRDRRAKNAEHN